MKQSAQEKLKGLGLDIEFLGWLEGAEPRLPDLGRIRLVKDADFAAAIRAVEWLAQHFSDPELIAPHAPEVWLSRYQLLEQFLHEALKSSLFYHAMFTSKDLEALEKVLQALLRASHWDAYREDILHLRKKGLPPSFPKVKAKPSGGTKQSEQTERMRAAIKHVSQVSKTPYGDLARFWNEQFGTERYTPQAGALAECLRGRSPGGISRALPARSSPQRTLPAESRLTAARSLRALFSPDGEYGWQGGENPLERNES